MTKNAIQEAAASLDAQASLPQFNTAPAMPVPASPICGSAGTDRCCETCVHIKCVAQTEPCGSCFRGGVYANWEA